MKKIVFITTLFVFSLSKIYAQGCSDAGFCTLSNNIKNDSLSVEKNSLEVGYIFGKGFEGITYNSGFINYSRTLSTKWDLNIKVTYNQATGDFGTRGQFGDAFITTNYTHKIGAYKLIKPLVGIKIPFTTGNLKINDIPLPMDYQASLGTFDLLLGAAYQYKKWTFDAAFQLPVLQTNKNSYFDEYSVADDFPTTNLFRRKGDVLLRSSYSIFSKNNRWMFKPNMMGIYHLGNDSYEDIFGNRQTIKNSEGLTINASLITHFNLNKNNSFQLNIATPLLVREIRPDGLTRKYVASLSYQFKF